MGGCSAFEEEELRAHQPYSLGARFDRGSGFACLADIGDNLDAMTVSKNRRLVTRFEFLVALVLEFDLELSRRFEVGGVRLHIKASRCTVKNAT